MVPVPSVTAAVRPSRPGRPDDPVNGLIDRRRRLRDRYAKLFAPAPGVDLITAGELSAIDEFLTARTGTQAG